MYMYIHIYIYIYIYVYTHTHPKVAKLNKKLSMLQLGWKARAADRLV